MNPLTQLQETHILPLLIALALAVLAGFTVAPAFATPPWGVATEFILGGPRTPSRWDEIDAYVKTGDWKARIDTKGESDLYVVRNTFDPLCNTGWHTHPGPSVVTVTSGTITAYDGDDPTCTPHVYPAGSTFIDPTSGGKTDNLRPGRCLHCRATTSWSAPSNQSESR